MKKYLWLIFLCITQLTFAQNNKQKIRGVITDKISQTTFPGAAVQIINRADRKGTTSDDKGNFTLSDLSPDRYELKISYLGYKDMLVPNVVVTSGKETILDIEMEENVTNHKNVFSQNYDDRSRSINTTYQLGFFPNFIYKLQF
jgi:hypothetical protein